MANEPKWEQQLLTLLFDKLGTVPTSVQHSEALDLLQEVYGARLDPAGRTEIRKLASSNGGKSPTERGDEVQRLLGIAAYYHYLHRNHPDVLAGLPGGGDPREFLQQREHHPGIPRAVSDAALRLGLQLARPGDQQTVEDHVSKLTRSVTMASLSFTFDPRSLPLGFDQIGFTTLVKGQLQGNVPAVTDELLDFVLGGMSLDGYLVQDVQGRQRGIKNIRYETEQTTNYMIPQPLDAGGNLTGHPNPYLWREALTLILQAFTVVRSPHNGSQAQSSYYEEFAFVSRNLLANSAQVPIDAPGLEQRVAGRLTQYVPGEAGGSLSLPPLSGEDGNNTELTPENIRAVALIYAANQLEELKLFQVVDRITEVFMNGQLPVGFDNGGKALDAFYWDSYERMTEAARRMQYTRILGAPGGEISREAQPNKQFNDLFLRFLSSLSEYDRQQRVGDVIGGMPREDSLTLTGEQVRKAARDLAANCSLFGWGTGYFAAQRLSRLIERELTILNLPEIQDSYGVQSPWQVIERVCAQDFGKSPNIVRFRTMAEAGKQILDIIAGNCPAWLRSGGQQPLFPDPALLAQGKPAPADIDVDTKNVLMRATEHWLAVNGIKEAQRAKLGEPEMITSAPSIPTATPDAGGAAFDQIRQMVSAGQAPSLDQLKGMIPDIGSIVHH